MRDDSQREEDHPLLASIEARQVDRMRARPGAQLAHAQCLPLGGLRLLAHEPRGSRPIGRGKKTAVQGGVARGWPVDGDVAVDSRARGRVG